MIDAILTGILLAEATILGLFTLLVLVAAVWDWADKKWNPRYPQCDIDPRCHPAFAWDKEGRGWIGGYLVPAGALR